jgi:hypothetical protein
MATGLTTLPIVLVSASSLDAESTAPTPLMLPTEVTGWTSREAPPFDWNPRVSTPGVESLTATFSKEARAVTVFVGQSSSRREKLSGAALDLAGSLDWLPALEERMVACDAQRCLLITHRKLLRREGKQVRHLYVAYVTGAGVVATPLAFRLGRAWAALTGRGDWGTVVALASDAPEGLESTEVAALVRALSASSFNASRR